MPSSPLPVLPLPSAPPHSPSPSPPPPPTTTTTTTTNIHTRIHDHGRRTPPLASDKIAEDTLKNIDLNGGRSPLGVSSSSMKSPTARPGSAPPPSGAGDGGGGFHSSSSSSSLQRERKGQQQQQQQQAHTRTHRPTRRRRQEASSTFTLVLAQIKRFDIEWCVGALLIIFVCTAVAIFTRDKGWFIVSAPLLGFPLEHVMTVFRIGLSVYTSQAHSASGDELVLFTHEGPISEISPRGGAIAVGLYIFLVLSLLLSVGLMWYIALFYSYLKSNERLPSREVAVRVLGAKALVLGVCVFALGTVAFRAVLSEDMKHGHNLDDASSPFSEIDTKRVEMKMGYAYGCIVSVWFFWLLVGYVLCFRSCPCAGVGWAKRARNVEDDGIGDGGEEEEEHADV